MRLKNLLLTMLVMLSTAAFAQLESGKVYRFINKADTNIALTASSTTDVYGTTKSEGDYAQLWLVEKHPNNADAWSLRSVGNGLYLTPRGTSTMWTFSVTPSSSTVLYCLNTSGNYYTLNPVNNVGNGTCMHYATSQGGAVVGWNTGADATHWTIESVEVSADDLAQNWKELDEFNSRLTEEFRVECQTVLGAMFEDAACTKLKKDYANVDALKADENYKKLPEELQNMAVKVFTGDWSEANFDSKKPGWGSEYGKRFRVQSIEPYSVAGEITDWFGINAHINMDNPTGLSGNYRQHMYVIVDGEIEEGAELWFCTIAGHSLVSNYNSGIELHKGLNIIPFSGNGNAIYINYVVHTYNPATKKCVRKISDYDNITIHFEGGNINGMFNGVGDHLWGEPDDDIDWQYYEERANLSNVTLLGKRQILHFCLNETEYSGENGEKFSEKGMAYYLPNVQALPGTPENKKVNAMLEAWDRIHLSELATMGLITKAEMDSLNTLYARPDKNWKPAGPIYDYSQAMYELQDNVDYGEYFNHHGVAYGNFSGYMSGGWKNCNYHHNTMGSIIGEIATNAGSTWGPAHEIGHQHQKVFSVNGLTEVTNNMHSNIAVWYMGLGTSRVNGTEGNLDNVYYNYKNKNHYLFHAQPWGSQNLWTQTQMYYKLWMYYHLAGHKTDFFPILFEYNRSNRMSSSNLGWIDGIGHASGTESMLKYYKQACDAAGEDLTEFFRAYGFFVTMNQQLRGDYSNSYYTQTQAEVDAAIASVKAKGYRENLAPLFINDCVNMASYSHDGKTKRSFWDNETPQGRNATIGMYTDCLDTSVKAEGYYYSTSIERNASGQTINKLTINRKENAKGAIGFIVYKDGELVAFTNNYTVELPKTIGTSPIDVYAVQADGSKVLLLTAAEAGTEQEQYSMLATSINKAKQVLQLIVKDGSETGYYFTESLAKLQEIYDNAFNAYSKKDQSVNKYGRWSMLLDAEYNNVTATAYMGIKEKAVYRITNAKKTKYALTTVGGVVKATTDSEVAADDNSKLWYLESTGNDGEYYIKDKNGNYISYVEHGMGVKVSTTSKKVFRAEHKSTGTFKLVTVGSTAETGLYVDESNYNSTGKFASEIITNDNLGYWKLVVVEGLEASREYEKDIVKTLIARADGILERAISTNDGEVVVNHSAVAPTDTTTGAAASLKSYFAAILDARNNAEVAMQNENVLDYLPYISDIRAAFESTDNYYYFTTPAKPDTDEETIYYIKNLSVDGEATLYCGADEEGKVAHTAIKGKESNKNYWWSFVPTGNENEYLIKNLGTGNYIYQNTRGVWVNSSTKGDKFTLAVPMTEENTIAAYGLTINTGTRYLITDNGYVGRGNSSNASCWLIEKLQFDVLNTAIEEVLPEDNDSTVEGIYDLMGRSVENPTRGIYIINGKKVFIK